MTTRRRLKAEYKSKLKYKDEESKETIIQLETSLKEKEKLLINLEKEFENYRSSKDTKPMAKTLLDDKKKKAEAIKWFNKAFDESDQNLKVAHYSKAIELDPQYAPAYINRGNAYSLLKEYKRAIADLNKGIELNPQEALAYDNRGYAYIHLKEYEKAIADLDKAIELNQQEASAYGNRGNAYSLLKEYEIAIADYNKAIELNQQEASIYINRGNTYSLLKEYEKAITDYNKAIELNPQNASAYLNLAELKIIIGKYEDAAKIITMQTPHVQDIQNRAVLLYLACIVGVILNMDISESEKEFYNLLKEKFTVAWSFVEFEDWLQTADITKAQKKYITELTQKLKDKK